MVREWEAGVAYQPGSVVRYRGEHYHVIQPHTSQDDWTPDCTPALWGRGGGGGGGGFEGGYGEEREHHRHHHGGGGEFEGGPPPQGEFGNNHGPPGGGMGGRPGYAQQPQFPGGGPQQGWDQQQQGYGQQQQGFGQQGQFVPQGSDDPRKQQQDGFNVGSMHVSEEEAMIGGGIIGTAAALGLGAFAYDKYKNSSGGSHDKQTAQGWEAAARVRQGQYLEAIKSNQNLPPVTWVLTENNSIPQGALQAGQESDGEPLYVGRVFYEGGVHLGKVSRKMKEGMHFSYGGKEHIRPVYEILLGYPNAVRWVDSVGYVDSGALRLVEGGNEADGRPLFIAQTSYKHGVHPGKCAAHIKGAYIAYGMDEKLVESYRCMAYA